MLCSSSNKLLLRVLKQFRDHSATGKSLDGAAGVGGVEITG
jgi:hypothetical protein